MIKNIYTITLFLSHFY